MRKLLATTLVAALAASGAAAQDWSGFYVGANVGYGWGGSDAVVDVRDRWDTAEALALRQGVEALWSTDLSPSGIVYGGQFGYNHQFGGGWVIGLEGDYSKLETDDSRLLPLTATPFGPSPTYAPGNSVDGQHLVAAKAKLGFATPGWLFYATGGWAMARVEGTAEVTSNGGYSKFGSDSEWLSGWVYGAGIETKLAPNWSVRVEYLRGDFTDFEYQTVFRPGSTFTAGPPFYNEVITQDFDLNLVRAAINFHL
jgi:outer membrane immunogenic protein